MNQGRPAPVPTKTASKRSLQLVHQRLDVNSLPTMRNSRADLDAQALDVLRPRARRCPWAAGTRGSRRSARRRACAAPRRSSTSWPSFARSQATGQARRAGTRRPRPCAPGRGDCRGSGFSPLLALPVGDEALEAADRHDRRRRFLPRMHSISHCSSCGQTRPQIAAGVLVRRAFGLASSRWKSPEAICCEEASGCRSPTGQFHRTQPGLLALDSSAGPQSDGVLGRVAVGHLVEVTSRRTWAGSCSGIGWRGTLLAFSPCSQSYPSPLHLPDFFFEPAEAFFPGVFVTSRNRSPSGPSASFSSLR
jgi:hypothetical protein